MASTPILVPVLYIALLVGALYTFSTIYRKRNAARISQMETWFPTHPERDTYISLLQLQPPPSDVLLKAALLKRAVADVQRIVTFREDKAALQQLVQKGSIGDDFWASFLAAEKELETEIVEVVGEANTFHPGWGQFIFQSASEVVNNMKHRDIFTTMLKLKGEQEAKMAATSPPQPKILPSKSSLLSPPTPQSSAPTTPQKTLSPLPKVGPTTPSTPRTQAASLSVNDASPSPQTSPGGTSKKAKKRK